MNSGRPENVLPAGIFFRPSCLNPCPCSYLDNRFPSWLCWSASTTEELRERTKGEGSAAVFIFTAGAGKQRPGNPEEPCLTRLFHLRFQGGQKFSSLQRGLPVLPKD